MLHFNALVDDIVTVSDEELRAAMRFLATKARLVAEPGGAAAVAACMFRADQFAGTKHRVAVLSGGNVDPALLASVLAESVA
jgi:threo-3-hydroxy-L-aspartate ammonia-lyase